MDIVQRHNSCNNVPSSQTFRICVFEDNLDCRGYLNNFKWISGLLGRDSAVHIATGYGLDDREFGVRVRVRSRIVIVNTILCELLFWLHLFGCGLIVADVCYPICCTLQLIVCKFNIILNIAWPKGYADLHPSCPDAGEQLYSQSDRSAELEVVGLSSLLLKYLPEYHRLDIFQIWEVTTFTKLPVTYKW
jgi:hypothetical protein